MEPDQWEGPEAGRDGKEVTAVGGGWGGAGCSPAFRRDPPHPMGREGQCSEEGEVTAVGGGGGSNGEKGGHCSEEGGGPGRGSLAPSVAPAAHWWGSLRSQSVMAARLAFLLGTKKRMGCLGSWASPPEPTSHPNLTPQPPFQDPSPSPKHPSLLFPRDVQWRSLARGFWGSPQSL